jgi:hypothetical protein
MSDYQPKPGFGSIFPNDRKEKDAHPDIKGDLCLEDGTVVKFAGWRKQTRAGKTFYSLKVDRPRDDSFSGGGAGADRGVSGGGSRGAGTFYDLNDDVPF